MLGLSITLHLSNIVDVEDTSETDLGNWATFGNDIWLYIFS